MALPLNVTSYGNGSIRNIVAIEFTTLLRGGFETAKIVISCVSEQAIFLYDVVNDIEIMDDSGTTVWEGFIFQITPGENTLVLTCVGYKSTLTDGKSVWSPNYIANTDTVSMIRTGVGLVTTLNIDSISAPNSGRSIVYQPESASLNSDILTHINELLKYGDSSNRMLTFQVWNGRKCYINRVPNMSDNPTYFASLNDVVGEPDFTYSLNNFYTKVTLRYRGPAEHVNLPFNNTDMQVRYKNRYGANFIREITHDITNHGEITPTQAAYVGNTLLNSYCGNGVRLSSSTLRFAKKTALFHSGKNTFQELYYVRAGETIALQGVRSSYNGNARQEMFSTIYGTRYVCSDKGESLEISTENSTDIGEQLAVLLSGVQALPE